ncbi:MAG: hypothetical protein NUV49_02355 [Patescibacteria group bacterium]|nr:hypothetical protein [Patescibacteria group bacterium]
MLNEKVIFLFLLLVLVFAGIAGAVLNGVEMRNDAMKKSIDAPRKETPEAPVVNEGVSQGGGCVPAGCSGQLCIEEELAGEIVTTCEYRPEYACYRTAVCERQKSGTCGWRETEELRICTVEAKERR